MPNGFIGVLQEIVDELWYHPFASLLTILILSPLLTGVGAVIWLDPAVPLLVKLGSSYFPVLIVLALLLNIFVRRTSARELFWYWVVWSVGITILAGFGYLELLFIKWSVS